MSCQLLDSKSRIFGRIGGAVFIIVGSQCGNQCGNPGGSTVSVQEGNALIGSLI